MSLKLKTLLRSLKTTTPNQNSANTRHPNKEQSNRVCLENQMTPKTENQNQEGNKICTQMESNRALRVETAPPSDDL